ncbi:MAG: transglutaminase domain-containing protein [Paludibacter sp.]|nr:transglutaminase domain-containing protein [Paludibacter sp.]
MKRFVLLYLLILPCSLVFGADYSKIDKQAQVVPDNLKTPEEIAGYLTRNLTSPIEKSRAIFYWISQNIKYDNDILNTGSNHFDRKSILDEVLRTHKGVCQHFAELFNACCQSVGIQSYVISGYTRQSSQLDPLSHAWNAVLIDSRYYEFDVTWAAAAASEDFIDQYFLVLPSVFIKTHMPFDPIWQFLNNPLTNAEFVACDYSKLKINSDYNYYDSISKLPTLTVLDKMIRENNRIVKSGLINSLVRERAALNQKNINLFKYNLAIENYNEGVAIYNSYLDAKYKNFYGGKLTQEQIYDMLAKSRKRISMAGNMLNEIETPSSETKQLIQKTQESIYIQKQKLNKEDIFVTNYFKTWKPVRILMD